MSAPTAYPLSWPKQKARCKSRSAGQFKATLTQAVDRLEREVSRIGGKALVISSNTAPLTSRQPDDPGVAAYFSLREKPIVLACDRYSSVWANLCAIAAHIEATRACERYGVATFEELFAGFVALPGATAPMDWREVLGNPDTVADAELQYRSRSKNAHPDKPGGSTSKMAALNAAIAQAREALK